MGLCLRVHLYIKDSCAREECVPGPRSNPAGVSSSRQSLRSLFCSASLLSPVPLCVRNCVLVSAHLLLHTFHQVSCCCCHLHGRSPSPTQISFLSTLDIGNFCACMVDSLSIFFLPNSKRVKPSSSSGDAGCCYWFIPGSLTITPRDKNTNKLTE